MRASGCVDDTGVWEVCGYKASFPLDMFSFNLQFVCADGECRRDSPTNCECLRLDAPEAWFGIPRRGAVVSTGDVEGAHRAAVVRKARALEHGSEAAPLLHLVLHKTLEARVATPNGTWDVGVIDRRGWIAAGVGGDHADRAQLRQHLDRRVVGLQPSGLATDAGSGGGGHFAEDGKFWCVAVPVWDTDVDDGDFSVAVTGEVVCARPRAFGEVAAAVEGLGRLEAMDTSERRWKALGERIREDVGRARDIDDGGVMEAFSDARTKERRRGTKGTRGSSGGGGDATGRTSWAARMAACTTGTRPPKRGGAGEDSGDGNSGDGGDERRPRGAREGCQGAPLSSTLNGCSRGRILEPDLGSRG